MTTDYDDDGDDIDPAKDAAEAFADYRPRRNFFRFPTADEQLESSPFYIEGVGPDDLVLSGAPPGYQLVPRETGEIFLTVKEEWAYQVHSLKPNGQWLKLIDELPERPASAKKIPDPRGGKDRTVWRTPEGHDVSAVLYLGLMRRIEGKLDPTVYTIKFQSGELSTYFRWRDEARALKDAFDIPPWASFWRWSIPKIEGCPYANWAFSFVSRWRDGSPGTMTNSEYRLAKAASKGKPQPTSRAAPTLKGANETKGAAPGKRDVPSYEDVPQRPRDRCDAQRPQDRRGPLHGPLSLSRRHDAFAVDLRRQGQTRRQTSFRSLFRWLRLERRAGRA
jgi:hypothetical protein